MKRWLEDALPYILIVAITLAVELVVLNLPVQATGGGDTNNCTTIGQVGALTIARCVDEDTGRELYANSAGFMVIVE